MDSFNSNGNIAKFEDGWKWIIEAFSIYTKIPLVWTLMATFVIFVFLLFSAIPFLSVFVNVIMPFLYASFAMSALHLEKNNNLNFGMMFDIFKHEKLKDLLMVGVIYLIGTILIVMVFAILFLLLGLGVFTDNYSLSSLSLMLMLIAIIPLTLSLLLLSFGVIFSPLLIVFNNIDKVDAMKISLNVCLKNWRATLLYGLAIMGLGFIAMIPFGLGFFVLLPIILISIYTAYKDLFYSK